MGKRWTNELLRSYPVVLYCVVGLRYTSYFQKVVQVAEQS